MRNILNVVSGLVGRKGNSHCMYYSKEGLNKMLRKWILRKNIDLYRQQMHIPTSCYQDCCVLELTHNIFLTKI